MWMCLRLLVPPCEVTKCAWVPQPANLWLLYPQKFRSFV